MIIIGIGSNLPSEIYGAPAANCEAALGVLEERGLSITKRARWYESAPVPVSDQPWFVNGAVAVETALSPRSLLELLHDIEHGFGRVRRVRNEARILDLDLIAYDDLVIEGEEGPVLPHPRMHERAFVLLPLRELAPDWIHPTLKTPIEELVSALPEGQEGQEIRAVE
ncbi:MAG: 2-amino-4-hydroxy-6-hydroxymethyldihydropteridine diphosphokinase [Alphaproteobacteria bacterium]|nr:2-amino-4-hydroxy-6-hydroxymethyldihydropteridine diphosphokinase [Alphaproteobacteria bacterium]